MEKSSFATTDIFIQKAIEINIIVDCFDAKKGAILTENCDTYDLYCYMFAIDMIYPCYCHGILVFISSDDELVYLDPHTAQPFVDVTAPGESDESYHCRYASRMRIADMDPSMALVSVIVCMGWALINVGLTFIISKYPDLPTFYEIKAEDLLPFGKKTWKIFMLRKYSDILSAGDTE